MPDSESLRGTESAAGWDRELLIRTALRGLGALLLLVLSRVLLIRLGIGMPMWLWYGSIPFASEFVINPAPSGGYPPGSSRARVLSSLFWGMLFAVMASVLLT